MTEVDGEQCTWHHHVDFQPGAGRRDIGRVQFYGDRIVETGIKADHLEVRHRLPGSRGGTAAIELVMEASERPVHPAWLLVASDCFMYVRDRRAVDSTAPSRARLLLQVDVEISSGYRPPWPWPWRIEHSTLPFREGRELLRPGARRRLGHQLAVEDGNTRHRMLFDCNVGEVL